MKLKLSGVRMISTSTAGRTGAFLVDDLGPGVARRASRAPAAQVGLASRIHPYGS